MTPPEAAGQDRSTRVAVVSPSQLFRETVAAALTRGEGLVAACFGNDPAAVLAQDTNDLLVLHIDALAGALCPADVLSSLADLPPTIVVGDGRPDIIADTLRAGARGWLSPRITGLDDLASALHRAADGEIVLDAETATMIARSPEAPADIPTDRVRITARQREVLDLVACGRTDQEVARELVISPATAKRHIEDARVRLAARNRTHAVTLALHAGIIDLADHDPLA